MIKEDVHQALGNMRETAKEKSLTSVTRYYDMDDDFLIFKCKNATLFILLRLNYINFDLNVLIKFKF